MVYDFPSPEWAAAYKDAINANAAYKAAAKDWTHGSVAMVVKADPALRIEEDTALWLDMHQGECRGSRLAPAKEAEASSAFVIVAPYALWKIVSGKCVPSETATSVHHFCSIGLLQPHLNQLLLVSDYGATNKGRFDGQLTMAAID